MLGSSIASSHSSAGDFFTNIFTGVTEGDPLSLVVVSILALIILRFVLARWMWTLLKQTIIFGGLAYGVWFASGAVSDRWGEPIGTVARYGGLGILAVMFFAMLYIFFARRAREQQRAQRKASGIGAPASPAPMAAKPGPGSAKPTAAGEPGTTKPTPATTAAPVPDESHSRLEDMLTKVNLLGATKDQKLLTVFVFILVAEFGVFTSKTVAAPSAKIGMILFAIFIIGAVVFVKSSYKNYWTGVRHFVFATGFALILSVLMLVYWQVDYCDLSLIGGNHTAGDCPPGAMAPVTWGIALTPSFYFASDALIATITGVAFGTLLTKGGG